MVRGGKRKGAGRKPCPSPKVQYNTRLDADLVKYLKQSKNAAGLINGTMRRTVGFRRWEKQQ